MKKSRNTAAKTKILNIITDSKTALSHSEIHELLDDFCDRVTIYRVLDRLIAEGFVHKIVNIDGVVKYAACHDCSSAEHHHNHIHFSCEQCRTVTCIEEVESTLNCRKSIKYIRLILRCREFVHGVVNLC